MAGVKISNLPSGTVPLAGTELVPVVQSGVTVKVAASALSGGGGGGTNPPIIYQDPDDFLYTASANCKKIYVLLVGPGGGGGGGARGSGGQGSGGGGGGGGVAIDFWLPNDPPIVDAAIHIALGSAGGEGGIVDASPTTGEDGSSALEDGSSFTYLSTGGGFPSRLVTITAARGAPGRGGGSAGWALGGESSPIDQRNPISSTGYGEGIYNGGASGGGGYVADAGGLIIAGDGGMGNINQPGGGGGGGGFDISLSCPSGAGGNCVWGGNWNDVKTIGGDGSGVNYGGEAAVNVWPADWYRPAVGGSGGGGVTTVAFGNGGGRGGDGFRGSGGGGGGATNDAAAIDASGGDGGRGGDGFCVIYEFS